MNIYELGKEHEQALLFLHASCTSWDFYEASIRLLAQRYHVIIPAMPGHDLNTAEEYTSVERVAEELERYLTKQGHACAHGLYGLSMGGSVAIRLLANGNICFNKAVIDAGITPYQLPWLVTRLIALRDFVMVELGKHSRRLLEAAYPVETYGKDGLDSMQQVLRHMTARTIWRVFESCNNYSMPAPVREPETQIQYWYGALEQKVRAWDIDYVKKRFPNTRFVEIPGLDHAELALLQPEAFARRLEAFFD
ncbi:MAG: alpha/beta hydrolase [Clostridiales bacterium]|nr:alpha/beta hydrolase [Clostridiales bacterium]MDO4349176.1 alpha/beta hydrolase [Eubacteriales bacterium]MDY4007690.1 alpha/beta hydrolase [Candidatus Limiplasma sp.]